MSYADNKANDAMNLIYTMIDEINNTPDESLNDEMLSFYTDGLSSIMPYDMKEKFIQDEINHMYQMNIDKEEAIDAAKTLREGLHTLVREKIQDEVKIKMGDAAVDFICDNIDEAANRYRGVSQTIHFQKLSPDVKLPAYAHSTDACADIFMPEDVIVPANSRGFKIPLGFKTAIPNGWVVYIYLRSGVSIKTPLRLANLVGVIDQDYCDEWNLLIDNVSDKDYKITKGDRIAQMSLNPVYYFVAKEIDDIQSIKSANRGGGLGSTGA